MYKTELMEKILKSPKAQEIVQMVSPIYGDAYTALWLFQCIGIVLDSLTEWSESIEKQVVPQTATWSLSYWEEQYGIIPEPTWSIDRRRQNIINRCRSKVAMNPENMSDIIAVAAGVDARIGELTGKNKFTVFLSAKKDMVNEDYVKSEIDKVKPAHLIYEILYERFIEGELYTGGAIQIAKEITLKQL